MSFIECTASWMSPANSASSISLVNSPLPPISDKGRSRTRSPVVVITTISTSSSASPCAAIKRARFLGLLPYVIR